jgi:hypothetical protein
MGDTVFASMVDDLAGPGTITFKFLISKQDFKEWQKVYTWDALHGIRYGQSFCNHFAINDNRLFYERNQQRCDSLIRHEYLDQQ